jgi:hypothetical protein
MGSDVTGRHPIHRERNDAPGQTIHATLTLRNRRRLEARVAIPRHLQLDVADLGDDGLRIRPVARVPGVAALDSVTLRAEMVGHLDLQPGLEHLTHERGQQPVVASQLDAVMAGAIDELGCPLAHRRLVTHQRHTTRRSARASPGPGRSMA